MDKPESRTTSIEHLRIYQLACSLEDRLYELAKTLPAEQFYPLGNSLRRSSASVAHYIAETHQRYSYAMKLESLHAARTAAEAAIRDLETFAGSDGQDRVKELVDEYTSLIKQCWGLVKYLKGKQTLLQTQRQAAASDELVAARTR